MRGIIRENGPIFARHGKKCNFDQNKKKIALLVQMGRKGAGAQVGVQICARSVNLTSQAHCVPAAPENIKFRPLQNFTVCHKKIGRFAFCLRLCTCNGQLKKAEASICWSFPGQRSNIHCSWIDSNSMFFSGF